MSKLVRLLRLPSDPAPAILRAALIGSLAAFTLYYILLSLHWPMMVDTPVMHYVVFLIRHGLRPYVDITDNNMPGAYLTEAWAMSLFGAGDLAWRLYEFFLLALLAGAMVVISLPYDWLAGLFGAGLFLLIHGSEGPTLAVEREQVITVLLMLAYASLFLAVRRRSPVFMLPFALAAALAGSIKPTFAPLGAVLLVLSLVVLYRRQLSLRPYLLWALGGFVGVGAVMLAFLLHFHALSAFLYLVRTVTPSYAELYPPGARALALRSFPHSVLFVALIAVVLTLHNRTHWSWERWSLLLGAAFGLFSYLLQGKAFLHHRYVFMTFLFLLFALEITTSLRKLGAPRLLAAAAVLYLVCFEVPHLAWRLHQTTQQTYLAPALANDLLALTKADPRITLQHQVQCFDLVYGCLNALYHLDLVENSSFTGDLLLFRNENTEATRFYRDLFWQRARQNPAGILVISNEWFGEPNSYDKLASWPEFVQYLEQNYTEVIARTFPEEDLPSPVRNGVFHPPAYRIYVRKNSPVLAALH